MKKYMYVGDKKRIQGKGKAGEKVYRVRTSSVRGGSGVVGGGVSGVRMVLGQCCSVYVCV